MKRMYPGLVPAILVVISMFSAGSAIAGDASLENNLPCPVAPYPGTLSMDDEFGYGTQALTHCLRNRTNAKVVVSVDYTHPYNPFGVVQTDKGTYVSNIRKMVNNYEVVHGMTIGKDVDIVVVFSQSGAALATKQYKWFAASNAGDPTNPFISEIQFGLSKGIKFYLCQEASRALGIKLPNVIDGVKFVPGGHIAVADFQLRGYALIRP